MTQPSFVPIVEADQVRPAYQLRVPSIWTQSRPSELRGPSQPGKFKIGSPGSDQGFALKLIVRNVTYILALDNINDELRQVLCMVPDPFDGRRNGQVVERRRDDAGILGHVRRQLAHKCAVLVIDRLILTHDPGCLHGIESGECSERVMEDGCRHLTG